MIENGIATEEELKKIDKEVKEQVERAVKFSVDSPLPPAEELVKDVYAEKSYTIKGRTVDEVFHVSN